MKKRRRKMVGRIASEIMEIFIIISWIYLSVLTVATGLTGLFGGMEMTRGEAMLLLGYGVYSLSEFASYVLDERTLLSDIIDMVIEYVRKEADKE